MLYFQDDFDLYWTVSSSKRLLSFNDINYKKKINYRYATLINDMKSQNSNLKTNLWICNFENLTILMHFSMCVFYFVGCSTEAHFLIKFFIIFKNLNICFENGNKYFNVNGSHHDYMGQWVQNKSVSVIKSWYKVFLVSIIQNFN